MAPRIKNISADELRRLFSPPEIESPKGLTVADRVALAQALEQRRSNELKQKQQTAEIERRIAEAEAKARDVETLSVERGTKATQEAEKLAREDIDPTQPGPEIGPLPAEDMDAIAQANAQAQAAFRIEGPEATLKREATESAKEKVATTAFERKQRLAQESFQRDVNLLRRKQAEKTKGATKKISALGQSKIFATEGFQNLVNELESGEKKVPKSFLARLGIKADSLAGGNLSELARMIPGIDEELVPTKSEAILFDQQRESLAVAVYKFVSGDVGNIAASESKRALKLIPAITDTKALRRTKIEALQRAAIRSKDALKTLINDPNSALLSPAELEKRQRLIADQALAEAALGVGADPTTEQVTREGLSPEEEAERQQLRRELGID
jgi:hypothetical protein